jgi:hypothetical protein
VLARRYLSVMVNGRLHGEQVVANIPQSNAMHRPTGWFFTDHSSFSQIKKFRIFRKIESPLRRLRAKM